MLAAAALVPSCAPKQGGAPDAGDATNALPTEQGDQRAATPPAAAPAAQHPPMTAAQPPAAPAPPAAAAIAASERARVGTLAALHARGVAEVRTTDEKGKHFDQGDIDLRWMPQRGFAASITKFGDRWAWIGSDRTSWWAFELKEDPVTLRTGRLDRARAGTSAAMPWLMALLPLVPDPDSEIQLRDGRAVARILTEGATFPAGTTVEAEFDARTLAPLAVRVRRGSEVVCESALSEIGSVETMGSAPGAWPRIPRRVRAHAPSQGEGNEIALFFETVRGDREAADKPGLYDLAQLRARFAPGRVEEDQP